MVKKAFRKKSGKNEQKKVGKNILVMRGAGPGAVKAGGRDI